MHTFVCKVNIQVYIWIILMSHECFHVSTHNCTSIIIANWPLMSIVCIYYISSIPIYLLFCVCVWLFTSLSKYLHIHTYACTHVFCGKRKNICAAHYLLNAVKYAMQTQVRIKFKTTHWRQASGTNEQCFCFVLIHMYVCT